MNEQGLQYLTMTNIPQNQQFQTPAPNAAPINLQSPEDDDVIDLAALFSAIWRGKWIIGFCAMAAVVAGGYYAFVTATPLYRSTAVVILETKQDSIVDLQSVVGGMTGDTSEVNSEVEVLRSRGLMGKVVDQLELTTDPEFNTSLAPANTINEVKSQIKTEIKAQLGLLKERVALPTEEAAKRTRDRVITALLGKTTVSNVRQSLVFQITVETENAAKSALIADTIVNRYILNQLEVKFEATEQATTWLTERVAELQDQLELATSAVSDFNASTELVSIDALQLQEVQLKDLRDRIRNTEDGMVAAKARFEALQVAQTRKDKAKLANDPQLTRFLVRAENDEQIGAAFDTRYQQVLARSELELNRSELQLTALRNSETEIEAQINQQSKDLIELQQLSREAEAVRLLYEYFLTRLKETSAQQGIQQADSRILSNAVVPTAPTSPRKSLILAMSGILGLMIGVGLVLLREARNNGFRTARELEVHTGYTVMGQIPQIPARTRKRILKYLSDKPTSAAAESIRNLRTSVLLSNIDQPPKVILSTSAIPGEGKTTNSLALAHNLVGLGKSVLLIEGDIRRRTLSQYFENLPEKGLVAALVGEQSLQESLHYSVELGADLLMGEKTSTNAADLFSSDKFKALIESVRAHYDVVIIDSPPVLVVPDARILAQVSDAVLFTVHWDKTSRHQVDEALRMFHNSNQRVTGLVLSQINAKQMKKYGYGGRYGAYAGYGAKYYNS